MFNLSYTTSYFAGVVSFFAPCIIPLLPAFISYLLGATISEFGKEKGGIQRYFRKIITSSFLYVLGFSLIFVLVGLTVTSLSLYIRKFSFVILRLGGLIIFILGLKYAGIINFKSILKETNLNLPGWLDKTGFLRPFVIGIIFAIAWTPCIGPVFGSILALAAVSETAVNGALLLFIYSLGISTPFILISLTLAATPKYLKYFQKNRMLITKFSGIILAILGFLLMTNTYRNVYQAILTIF